MPERLSGVDEINSARQDQSVNTEQSDVLQAMNKFFSKLEQSIQRGDKDQGQEEKEKEIVYGEKGSDAYKKSEWDQKTNDLLAELSFLLGLVRSKLPELETAGYRLRIEGEPKIGGSIRILIERGDKTDTLFFSDIKTSTERDGLIDSGHREVSNNLKAFIDAAK